MTTAEMAAPPEQEKFGRLRNPIFQRELITLLRSKKAFILLAVYLAISAALLLLSWPQESSTLLLQGAISREVFGLFALGQTLLLALLIPATLGTSMTMEKEGETIDLLLTTPVSGDSILLGKLMSGLVYLLFLALVSVPILLLCYVLGGLSAQDVLGLYFFLFLQSVLFGLTSIFCSAFLHRTQYAVIISYILVGVEAVALSAIYGDGLDFFTGGTWFTLLITAVPPAVILYFVTRDGVRRPYTAVRKPMEEEDARETVGLIIRRDSYPDKLIVPARRTSLMEDGTNPVLDKELQAGIYGSGSLFVRLVIQLGMVLSLGAFFWTLTVGLGSVDVNEVMHPEYVYLCFIIGYVMTIGPSIAARTFTHEKEERTIESLLITLIPRTSIVLGKFLAIVRVVAALTLMNCVGFLIIVAFSSYNWSQMLVMAITIVSVTVFTTALGMMLSLICRSTLAAMIGTYFTLFILYVGPLLANLFLTKLFPGTTPQSIGWIVYLSPLLAVDLPSTGGENVQLMTILLHGMGSVALGILMLAGMVTGFEAVLKKQAQKLL